MAITHINVRAIILETMINDLWEISRQWHGHKTKRVWSVSQANSLLRRIINDNSLPPYLRLRAATLQEAIIRNNASPRKETLKLRTKHFEAANVTNDKISI